MGVLPWGGFRNTKVKDECWKQCKKKVQPYYTDFLGGACPEGHALTEGECASLHGQAVDGNNVFYHGAGYWGNPESCGCYFDQNGNVYFNTRTEECYHMDRWEM